MSVETGSSEKIAPLDWYHIFRDRIEHEDNLIVQRLSWLVASQSFFFTAFAIVTNGITNLPANTPHARLSLLAQLVPIVATLTSFLIYITILAGLNAIQELRRNYYSRPDKIHLLPLQTSARTRLFGISAPLLLPLLFISVWGFILTR